MNESNFNQTGGYPLNTERLQELQTTFSVFGAFGNLAGNLTILSGCELVGTTVSDGVVFINGEVLNFKTGYVDTSVIIIEETVSKEFENATVKPVYKNRYATFGTSDTSWPWVDFIRPVQTKTLEARLSLMEKKLSIFQSGGVVFPWFKPIAEIPDGFQEVVDMRGRTIFGHDSTQTEFSTIGNPGGAKNKALSIAEMPEHDHSFSSSNSDSTGLGTQVITTGTSNEPAGKFGMTKTGNSQAFSILNPYRVAAYIEFIG